MFKIGFLSLGKFYGKMRNLGYKLGLVEFKIEDIDIAKIPRSEEYEKWHPGEEKENKSIKEVSTQYRGEVSKYFNKGNQ